jgi:hypothetical protein
MLRPFFEVAMQAPVRQLNFRRMAVGHVLFLAILASLTAASGTGAALTIFNYVLLALGMIEGSALIGWRLTQLPKSQALEFLLVSPVQPKRLFLAEALVGALRFAWVWLAGLPIFTGLQLIGTIEFSDLWPLVVLPFLWGLAVALALTAWIYEPLLIRRIGELLSLLGVLAYLVVGVLAGENLVLWLQSLPPRLGQFIYDCVIFLHTMNPFGVVRYWFAADSIPWIAQERIHWLCGVGAIAALGMMVRAAFRLRGHFQERHYKPLSLSEDAKRAPIGDDPLSWWAVKRVMEYSGRINLWLASGFALTYAAFLIAGDHWPAWMGRLVFQIFEMWGGAPTVATALAVMAAVPAVFQFGLWDATTQDRCKRLELLLLTDLTGQDYWLASLTAAWKRGRGYLSAAAVLWLALGISGRATPVEALASMLGGLVLWAVSFAVGFRAFATGHQSSGIASLITLGFPLMLFGMLRLNWITVAGLIPTALPYMPATHGVTPSWALGCIAALSLTTWLTRLGLQNCDRDLRLWYDANQGQVSAG